MVGVVGWTGGPHRPAGDERNYMFGTYIDIDGTTLLFTTSQPDAVEQTLRDFARGLELGSPGPDKYAFTKLVGYALHADRRDWSVSGYKTPVALQSFLNSTPADKRGHIVLLRVKRTAAGRVQVWREILEAKDLTYNDGVNAVVECFERALNSTAFIGTDEDSDEVYVTDLRAILAGILGKGPMHSWVYSEIVPHGGLLK